MHNLVAIIAFCDSSNEPILFESSVIWKFQKIFKANDPIFKMGVGVMIQSLFQKNKTRLMQN